MVVDTAKAIEAIIKARPPETDRFTYLAVIEANLCAGVLPALNDILQDASLCQDIGWDLIYNLCRLPGADACLETIARLGNPREVILKVLETLDLLEDLRGHEQDDDDANENEKRSARVPDADIFITLLGMLAILHRRIQTRFPSRFLAQTLKTVYASYRPDQPGMAAAVLNLVHSLSGRRRPPLPTRLSSINVANPDQDGDASKNAPDPEADGEYDGAGPSPGAHSSPDADVAEEARQQRLLLSFVTCILEAYVDGNDMAWAARLVEFYNPHRILSLRRTMMAAFREDKELSERDAMVGKLVALTRDLGLSLCSDDFLAQLCTGSIDKNPLSQSDEAPTTGVIALSTGGCICLLAYWVFSSTLFDADQPVPAMYIFPNHFALLSNFLKDQNAELRCALAPGVAQAVISIGLWLHAENHIVAAPSLPPTSSPGKERQQQQQQQQQQQHQQQEREEQLRRDQEPAPHQPAETATTSAEKQTLSSSDFMRYLHLLTLLTVYHPILRVRDAGVTLAGLVLHADPADEDRLRILDDLLENCVFPKLKACAVTWLREEFLTAAPTAKKDASGSEGQGQHQSIFAGPQAFETVQYSLFPNLRHLPGLPAADLEEYLGENMAFLLQVANLGLFLFSRGGGGEGDEDGAAHGDGAQSRWAHVLPPNAEATVRERWLGPLGAACQRVKEATTEAEGQGGRQSLHALLEGPDDGGVRLGLEILGSCLNRLAKPMRGELGTAGGAE